MQVVLQIVLFSLQTEEFCWTLLPKGKCPKTPERSAVGDGPLIGLSTIFGCTNATPWFYKTYLKVLCHELAFDSIPFHTYSNKIYYCRPPSESITEMPSSEHLRRFFTDACSKLLISLSFHCRTD